MRLSNRFDRDLHCGIRSLEQPILTSPVLIIGIHMDCTLVYAKRTACACCRESLFSEKQILIFAVGDSLAPNQRPKGLYKVGLYNNCICILEIAYATPKFYEFTPTIWNCNSHSYATTDIHCIFIQEKRGTSDLSLRHNRQKLGSARKDLHQSKTHISRVSTGGISSGVHTNES